MIEDLLQRQAQGEAFSEEDLGTFGGRLRGVLEEAWPGAPWSSYQREKDILGAEVKQ